MFNSLSELIGIGKIGKFVNASAKLLPKKKNVNLFMRWEMRMSAELKVQSNKIIVVWMRILKLWLAYIIWFIGSNRKEINLRQFEKYNAFLESKKTTICTYLWIYN